MRYINLPAPVELPVFDQNGKPIQYTLERYLAENVWTHEFWRETLQAQDTFFRLFEKFTDAFRANAKFVGVEDADYEMLLPLVTQKGVKLNPSMVLPLQMLMKPFFSAGTKPPEEPPTAG